MPGTYVKNMTALRSAQQLSRAALARMAKVSDRIVTTVEAGGACEPAEAVRLLAAVQAVPAPSAPPESVSRGVVESGRSSHGSRTSRNRS